MQTIFRGLVVLIFVTLSILHSGYANAPAQSSPLFPTDYPLITADNAPYVEVLTTFEGDNLRTTGYAFRPGELIISHQTDTGGEIYQITPQGNRLIWQGTDTPHHPVFLPQDNQLAFVAGGSVILLTMGNLQQAVLYENTNTPLTSLAPSPTGGLLAVGHDNGTVLILDRESGGTTLTLSASGEAVTDVAFHPADEQIAVAYANGTLRLWNLADGEETFSHTPPSANLLTDITFSPDGSLLAAAYDDLGVIVWSEGKQIAQLAGDPRYLDFSPDGTLLAGGSRFLYLWEMSGFQQRLKIKPPQDDVNGYYLSFSSDGSFLMSGSRRPAVWAVNAETLQAAPSEADRQLAEQGEALMRRHGCSTCHSRYQFGGPPLHELSQVGSRIEGLSLEEYIRQSILYPDEFIVAGYPRGIHPTYYASTIDESDVEVLIQYILSMTPEG